MRKKLSLTLSFILVTTMLFASCSSSKDLQYTDEYALTDSSSYAEYAEAEEAIDKVSYKSETPTGGNERSKDVSVGRTGSATGQISKEAAPDEKKEKKIIYTTHMNVETDEYDKTIEEIQTLIKGSGGYIENSQISGGALYSENISRNASFVVRVPSNQSNSFVDLISAKFHVSSLNQSSQDITRSYYDTDSWLKTLEGQHKRLEELANKSGDLESLLEIERELASVRYDIETTNSTLRGMDDDVSYATVTINISEVIRYTQPPTDNSFGARIKNALHQAGENTVMGFENFVISLVRNLPSIIVWAVIILLVILVIRRFKKKSKKNKLKQTTMEDPTIPLPEEQITKSTNNNQE